MRKAGAISRSRVVNLALSDLVSVTDVIYESNVIFVIFYRNEFIVD